MNPEYHFELEDLEYLAAAIEARKPDPDAIHRLRVINEFFDMETPDAGDRVH